MKTLYARAIWLRNCGRFTHISSDFGSQYRTHTFVTSEALYASLTRGVTWCHLNKFVDLEEDIRKSANRDYFFCDYDVAAKPIWFTPGLIVDEKGETFVRQPRVVDKHDFNVITEGYPSTGGENRPSYVPTYGTIESILPGQLFLTYAFSTKKSELEFFKNDQIFLMGKKRTMFQVIKLSELIEGEKKKDICEAYWLEIKLHELGYFSEYNILAATMRYFICRGKTKNKHCFISFCFNGRWISVPDFYLNKIPFITVD